MGASSLATHVNYKQGEPFPYETQIEYALREAAHLLSPPMTEGESQEIECVEAAKQIRALAPKLQKLWDEKYNQNFEINDS
jgi:hypothetical protein